MAIKLFCDASAQIANEKPESKHSFLTVFLEQDKHLLTYCNDSLLSPPITLYKSQSSIQIRLYILWESFPLLIYRYFEKTAYVHTSLCTICSYALPFTCLRYRNADMADAMGTVRMTPMVLQILPVSSTVR